LTVIRQFIRDLSFESPRPSDFLTSNAPAREKTTIASGDAVEVAPSVFEVVLTIEGTAKRGELVGYIVELTYVGLFRLANLSPERQRAALLVEAPELLFPFALNILSRLMRANGFPVQVKSMPDFVKAYADRLKPGNPPVSLPARQPPAL
jgi:preprotein translocase subunit SecB